MRRALAKRWAALTSPTTLALPRARCPRPVLTRRAYALGTASVCEAPFDLDAYPTDVLALVLDLLTPAALARFAATASCWQQYCLAGVHVL